MQRKGLVTPALGHLFAFRWRFVSNEMLVSYSPKLSICNLDYTTNITQSNARVSNPYLFLLLVDSTSMMQNGTLNVLASNSTGKPGPNMHISLLVVMTGCTSVITLALCYRT